MTSGSISPLDLARKILGDLGPGPFDYSRLRNGDILLSKKLEAVEGRRF
jgi:hypothetical protein